MKNKIYIKRLMQLNFFSPTNLLRLAVITHADWLRHLVVEENDCLKATFSQKVFQSSLVKIGVRT